MPIIKPVFSVPLFYVIVTVLLNFENDGGLEDDFGAPVLQNHNVAALDPEALAHGRRERDLTPVGNDEWIRHFQPFGNGYLHRQIIIFSEYLKFRYDPNDNVARAAYFQAFRTPCRRERMFKLASTLASLVALAGTCPASAATTVRDTSDVIEEVVVTGTWIPGTPEDDPLHVTRITRDDLRAEGSPGVIELLRNLSFSQGADGDSKLEDVTFLSPERRDRPIAADSGGTPRPRGHGSQVSALLR